MNNKTDKLREELVNIQFTHHTDEIKKELLVNKLREELINTGFTYQTDTVNHNSFRRNS